MSPTMPTNLLTRVDLDERTGDALVEALVYSTPYKDPFDQAAVVAEHLWDNGIVLAHSAHLVGHMALMATLWGLIGAFIALAGHTFFATLRMVNPVF